MTQPHNAVGFQEAMTLANALPLIADVVEAAEQVAGWLDGDVARPVLREELARPLAALDEALS